MLIYDNFIHSKLSNTTIDFIDISSTYIAIGIIQYRLGKYKQAFKYYRIPFYFLEIVQCDNCKDADKKDEHLLEMVVVNSSIVNFPRVMQLLV